VKHYIAEEWEYYQYEVNNTTVKGVFATSEEALVFVKELVAKRLNENYREVDDSQAVYDYGEGFAVRIVEWDNATRNEIVEYAYKRA